MNDTRCPFCDFSTPIDDGGDLVAVHLIAVHHEGKGLRVYKMSEAPLVHVICWCGQGLHDYDFAAHLALFGGATRHFLEVGLFPLEHQGCSTVSQATTAATTGGH